MKPLFHAQKSFLLIRDGSIEELSRPCVIYLHGNCSSRLEAIHCGCLKLLLPLGVSVLCFDFTGSGLSEGNQVQRSEQIAIREGRNAWKRRGESKRVVYVSSLSFFVVWNVLVGDYVSLGWYERQDLEEVRGSLQDKLRYGHSIDVNSYCLSFYIEFTIIVTIRSFDT